jgi:murein DD-endopeptidase MepM/ murein hydrolase activator NlpD
MKHAALTYFALGAAILSLPFMVFAQSTADIQKQIDDNNAQIQALDAEIAQYQKQLDSTTAQKNTLQNTVNQLALQQKQLSAKISVTQSQIKTTQLQITQLSSGIASAQSSIEDERAGLAQSLRSLNQSDQVPLALSILSSDTIADAWRDIDASAQIHVAIQDNVALLANKKQDLTDTKTEAEQKQAQLKQQQATLNTQQGSLAATKKAQSDLLAQTKNQESTYQSIIAQKQAAKDDFEETINALQAKLKAADTTAIPTAGSSVLAWPLKSVYITQYFGDTEFSRTAAYKGNGHNGIDLRAAIGTPVYAALSGTVWDTNLGIAPNCQYGKWVLVKHANGLTTLYAHLSSISVAAGQTVTTGQLLGYSGNTGYATGPHLHFGVYVSSAISFINYKCASGPTVKVPVSPFNGYLNPILYLPAV